MASDEVDQTEDRLALRSRLSDIAQASAWTEELASQYAIPPEVKFAMDLCLEEAVSNIIRHGYAGKEEKPIILHFAMPRDGYFVVMVDDEAPYFNLLDAPELPMVSPNEDRVGGLGIRLLRQFADVLEYEPMPTGNRLRMGFLARSSNGQTK
jgi:anti-sigma regulatory factor (Ser/Thr protein kinase)